MEKNEEVEYNLSLQTCHIERMDFIKCMQLSITKQHTREKKEKKCKEFFDKYLSCMKVHENTIMFMN